MRDKEKVSDEEKLSTEEKWSEPCIPSVITVCNRGSICGGRPVPEVHTNGTTEAAP